MTPPATASAPAARRPRNARIEALRLAAILGIAVFHTAQPWFEQLTSGLFDASPALAAVLGCISLLGAYGNHVFYLVSGMFLIPAAARAAGLRAQAAKTLRRVGTIAAPVLFWALAALAFSAWVAPLEDVRLDQADWLASGLEFIWVYLALVASAPVVGWVWKRLRRPRAVVVALTLAVMVVNAYIAFLSPGDVERGLLEWRKLMSAASYLVAFLCGGALGTARLERRHAGRLLAVCAAVCVAAEAGVAAAGNLELMYALSFKSTSALSFCAAVASVAFAASRPASGEKTAGAAAQGAESAPSPGEKPANSNTPAPGALGRLSAAATPSILGFYVVQSFSRSLWEPAFCELAAWALAAGGEPAFLASLVAVSSAFVAATLLVDRFTRVKLLKHLGLA